MKLIYRNKKYFQLTLNKNEMVQEKPAKKLKSLCIEKLLETYGFDCKFPKTCHFNNVIKAFQKFAPVLSRLTSCTNFTKRDTDFNTFLWFSYYFIWNKSILSSFTTDFESNVFKNWITKTCHILDEVEIVGFTYKNKKMSVALPIKTRYGPNFKEEFQLNPLMLNYQPLKFFQAQKNSYKSLKLTVYNCDMVPTIFSSTPVFFDFDQGVTFNICKTLKILGYPGIKCNAETYYCLLSYSFFKVVPVDMFCMRTNLPPNSDENLCVFRFVEKKKLNKFNSNLIKSEQNFKKYLKSLKLLEEVELNLINVSNKQKMSIVKNLNSNIKSLTIVFYHPASFLLYIGTRFKNLQTLDVSLAGKDTDDKQNRFFNYLMDANLSVFVNLKSLKFNICNYMPKPPRSLLSTFLTILKGCQNTLTSLDIEFYNFEDIKKIVDFLCSHKMPLKFLTFKFSHHLTSTDVMRIVKFYKDEELLIKIYDCDEITYRKLRPAQRYIRQNNLKLRLKNIIFAIEFM